ncbi:hypothetical protein JTE90_005402 [Oedothorax gibbosus]|uniref:Trinucleotide repeat-containing gene 18 protein n=1 Tax=Oedothorax gibbosus TaxID=931172 RepID=A0AAV6U1Z2_9ARAC|nr:hypothetical protein JTE90_005402 [Oedothorax gibbosus]
MNGRVFRSPVLAWNVDSGGPFADMPAAAAAISPAADPYGRCWQNQHVDAGTGTSFPYFGTLYNNSLPPTAYRLQPGCMPTLGQFWPPTPPPDGCGRYDGGNLYFGPPVLRHTENISSNIRNSFQGLGHYSHLVETSKEQNQRLFKRETPISPNVSAPNMSVCSPVSKSDSFNNCCAVDSKMKSPSFVAYSLPKQELHTVSSGHEPYLCSSDIRSSSMHHPSIEKSHHFSPSPHSLKNNTLNFHSQDRTKAAVANQENCNASPLKNVYFSHYESENINSVHNSSSAKNFSSEKNERTSERPFQYDKPNSSVGRLHMQQSPPNSYLQNFGRQQAHNNNNSSRSDGVTVIKEKYKQKSSSSYKVKPEKNPSDCKYQKQRPVQEYKNSEMFNIPTSVLHSTKLEPKDKYFLPSCSSTAPSCMATSYATSGPFFVAKDLSQDLRTSYPSSIYQNSCNLGKPWHYSDLPAISLESYFRAPEASRPPLQQNPPHVSSAIQEDLISVAQTAPQEISVPSVATHNLQQPQVKRKAQEAADDEVQIIGVQNKHLSAKHDSRHSSERKPSNHVHHPSVSEPMFFKSEKETCPKPKQSIVGENQTSLKHSHYKAPPVLQIEESIKPSLERRTKNNEHFNLDCRNSNFSTNSNISSSTVTIKQELLNENELPTTNCVKFPQTEPVLISEQSQKPPALVCELPQKQPALVCELPRKQPALVCELPQKQPALVCELPQKQPALVCELPQKQPALVCEIPQNPPALVSELSQEKLVHSERPTSGSNVDSKDLLSTSLIDSYKTVVQSDILELDEETDYNENHGLHLLLNTIEKVTSFEKVKCPNDLPPLLEKQENTPKKMPIIVRGLDLLSEIAGQRLVSEFDLIKTETSNESIKCNYPEIKESKLLSEEDQKQMTEAPALSAKSSVSEIQNILVELKKKYKQKQKELSRLKPKHRFASSYLKGRPKTIKKEFDQSSTSGGNTTDVLNSSFSSVSSEFEQHEAAASNSKLKSVCKKVMNSKSKRVSRFCSVKKETTTETEHSSKRITRRSLGKSKTGDKILEISEHSKTIKRNSRSKVCKVRKVRESDTKDLPQVSDESTSKAAGKEASKKSNSLPEKKRRKVYSLRQSSQSGSRKTDSLVHSSVILPKAISSKRKSDNPKKFVPSKQSKLSETIVAKHLRNRILFDASGSTSDDENLKDGVPDDLYVAFEECHLDEQNKNASKPSKNNNASNLSNGGSLAYPEPSKLCVEHLVERQRLLALEDGLFYAGFIKECQSPKKYGIALDGQRGNRLHMFTREELLTQTIVESKPLTSELPEGTRVCAYWSQQYRCLYPGVVGKAPCPSADWSEPRVFVLFDDGDSGQIPAKNVRLIPPDIIPAENICRSDSSNTSTSNANSQSRSTSRGQSRRIKCSSPTKHSDTSNEVESKDSSSSCDDSCSSPSQQDTPTKPPQAKKSKHKQARRHKKYKEKHRRHHHHHRRHHRHHHHHHHSKKRRHRRKKDTTPGHSENNLPQDIVC